jgi:hypothetical protein
MTATTTLSCREMARSILWDAVWAKPTKQEPAQIIERLLRENGESIASLWPDLRRKTDAHQSTVRSTNHKSR